MKPTYFQWKNDLAEHIENRLDAINDSSPERCFGYIGRTVMFIGMWAYILHLIWVQSPIR